MIEKERRKIVCLCGSTKFKKDFEEANKRETLNGNVVLSVGCFMHSDSVPITAEQKADLDKLHLDKVEMADEVLVINVGGYVGESTRGEIAHAERLGKPIRYLEE